MPYLYIVIAITILFIALHKFTELEMKPKVIIAVALFVLIVSFYFFEQANKKSALTVQDLRFAFDHGKKLLCKDKEVDKSLYNYASRSFIGKKDTKMFGSQNIAIGDCKIKP